MTACPAGSNPIGARGLVLGMHEYLAMRLVKRTVRRDALRDYTRAEFGADAPWALAEIVRVRDSRRRPRRGRRVQEAPRVPPAWPSTPST